MKINALFRLSQNTKDASGTTLPWIFKMSVLILIMGILFQCTKKTTENANRIMTINGPIDADSLGLSLIHEHVFLDWRTADSTDRKDWDQVKIFNSVLPHIQEVRKWNVKSMFECTPNYLGRNVALLQKLSEATGILFITNTGYYGARHNIYVPTKAYGWTAEQIADVWIHEFNHGIDDSGVIPGFIKISVDPDSTLSDLQQRLVQAAALTHKATGLTIVSHTGIDTAAFNQVAVLAQENVSPSAFVWTHAQNGSVEGHLRMARMGGWISLDGLGWVQPQGEDSSALYRYLRMIRTLKDNDCLHRVLLSMDAGWYSYGEGDNYVEHTALFTTFIPLLRKNGFTQPEIIQILVENPRDAYTIRTRLLGNGT